MKISYNWLQNYFNEKLPEPQVIADGIILHSFEVEEVEKVGDDTIFEIKILPDRAHDCLCHFGIAKEISGIFNIKLSSLFNFLNTIEWENKDVSGYISKQSNSDNLQIEVKNSNCHRYMGRIIKNVKVGPSPVWLSEALVAIGQKSINNIVDATNYVMFDIGNPIHAFDLNKLESPKIIVQNALNGEKFTLLDGKDVILDDSMLTIRDEKDALVIAGVKGGKKAEIDNNTKNIVIEVANFEPVSTRKTAKKLSIFTESAKRFENEISPTLVPFAMEKITDLILKIAGGEAYEIVDIYKNEEKIKKISFTKLYLEKMLGLEISEKSISNILERFNYKYTYSSDGVFEVEIPFLRLDLNEPYDMVEEIGRIYGYDKVIPVLPKINFEIKENKNWLNINKARNYLISKGYREVMNYAFTDKGDIEVMASASDKNFLRTNLLDGLLKSYELNRLNLPLLGMSEVKIFEIGTVFTKKGEEINVAFCDKKNKTEISLDKFVSNFEEIKSLSIISDFPVFKLWSPYPFIARDISIWLPEDENKNKLENIFDQEGTNLLIKKPYLFDQFTKEGRTSFAYRLVFQSYDRTLTDEEVTLIMSKINEKIISSGWEIR